MDLDDLRTIIFEYKEKIHFHKSEGTLSDSYHYLSKNFPGYKTVTFTKENLLKMIYENSDIFTRKYTLQNIDFYGVLNEHDKNIIDSLIIQFNTNHDIILTMLYYMNEKNLTISSISFFDIDNGSIVILHKSGIIEIKYYDHRSKLKQSSKKMQKIIEKFFERNAITTKEDDEFEVVENK